MGYSNGQIQFILEHYIDLASGNMPVDKATMWLKSVSGRKDYLTTFSIWKADIDLAISSLCPEHDHWHLVATEITPSMLLHISRSKDLSRMQRDIVSLCIIRDCQAQDCERAIYCENQGIITRMRKFLNGKFANKRYTEQEEKSLIVQIVQ
jgi:hypothetical protein